MVKKILLGCVLLAGCEELRVDYRHLPCDQGKCLDGYVCNADLDVCAPVISVGCEGSGLCPSSVRTGDACSSVDSFIPCEDGATACGDLGCRTCLADGTWSACGGGQCTLGLIESCASCSDDCTMSVQNAVPSCSTNHCDYASCESGFGDADGVRANGCECEALGVEIVCNGVDEDCDGDDLEENDTIDNCGGCDLPCVANDHVDSMRCDTTGAPTCRIQACDSGFIDVDGLLSTGCERACTPSGAEVCDGSDNDCSGTVDDISAGALATACNNEIPNAHVATWACVAAGCRVVTCQTGFYDVLANVPGCEYACTPSNSGIETCDDVDNDCNGSVDDVPNLNSDCGAQHPAAASVSAWACDGGDCEVNGCSSGTADVNGDATDGCESTCVPTTPSTEVCDNVDNDCDGTKDNQGAGGCTTYYRDDDHDTYGRDADTRCTCSGTAPYNATRGGDCDDSPSACGAGCRPGLTETCDGNDNNCDNVVPNTEVDNDGDTYVECTPWNDTQNDQPAVVGGNDCDDNTSACGAGCFPGNTAFDICDSKNQDCDGSLDEEPNLTWYHDKDGDTFTKTGDTTKACTNPDAAHYRSAPSAQPDCDDETGSGACGAGCYPGNSAADICDSKNQDCDASTDEDPNLTWYHDNDGDGFTKNSDTQLACVDPDGAATKWVSTSTTNDCDDATTSGACGAGCFPGNTAPDICDGKDQDCDGSTDENPAATFYRDADTDTYGNLAVTQQACSAPAGYVANSTDCDDTLTSVHPTATELCNNRDDDCDTVKDDGLGAACTCTGGAAPFGYEICSDTIDNDCDVQVDEVGCGPTWWQCTYDARKPITITTVDALPAGYAVSVTFDHAALVSAGKARADGNDLRVIYASGSTFTEVARVLDPESAWNTATTTVWFALSAPIGAATADSTHYALYYFGPNGTPPASEANVFTFADFFDRAAADAVGNGWTVSETDGTDLDIANNALTLVTGAGADYRPSATHAITTQSGKLVCAAGFDVTNSGDTEYRVELALGSGLTTPTSPASAIDSAGAGPLVLSGDTATWDAASPATPADDSFGSFDGTVALALTNVSGYVRLEIAADIATDTYTLSVTSGSTTLTYPGLTFANVLSSIDSLRITFWRVDEASFGTKQIDWIYVRPDVSGGPATTVGVEIGAPC